MLKSKTLQKGFTIVELLIVIVVIGILAALVLNTFSGVQKRARDAERQTDVTALATQLEVYYSDEGGYPQFSQIDTAAEVKTMFKGIDEGAVVGPNSSTTNDLQSTVATTADATKYGYVALNSAGTACIVDDGCTEFTLSWVKEDGTASVLTKKSLNVN